MQLMFQPFYRYWQFSGRARRQEFWLFLLLTFLVGFVFGLVGLEYVVFLWGLAIIVPWISLCVRRLHDLGHTGWLVLLKFIPIINLLFYLYIGFKSGEAGSNTFGPDPLEDSNS